MGKKIRSDEVGKLPIEILREEIFHRLPIKTLARLKFVCKAWHSIISDPQFVQEHAIRHPPPPILLVLSSDPLNQSYINPVDYESPSSSENTRSIQPVTTQCILGSCDGLVVILRGVRFYCWNLSTGESRFLFRWKDRHPNLFRYELAGFFRDCSSDGDDDDYIFVHVTRYSTPPMVGRKNEDHIYVDLFSLRTGNMSTTQDRAQFPFRNYNQPYDRNGTVINGRPHWLVRCDVSKDSLSVKMKNVLIYFDAHQKRFKKMSRNMFRYKDEGNVGLGALNGCLSVIEHMTNEMRVRVWVMKEYGVEESWDILYDIWLVRPRQLQQPWDWDLYKMRPLCCTMEGEILIEVVGMGIMVYNPITIESEDELRKLDVVGDMKKSTTPALYAESLVSPYLGRYRR